MTDKLFCPKCKGEVVKNDDYKDYMPWSVYWCNNCCSSTGRPFFEIDCLTKEQLRFKKASDAIEVNAISSSQLLECGCKFIKKKVNGCSDHPIENKQTPSVCFHLYSQRNKLNDNGWIKFSDRKPMIGQEIDFESYDICEETGREILSCIGMNAFYDPSEYFHKKIKKWIPAQDDMISFSELTPLIKVKQAAQQELKKCPVCSGHMTYKSTRRSDVGLNEQLWQCNSCKVDCGILQPSNPTVKDSSLVENQTAECEHDNSSYCPKCRCWHLGCECDCPVEKYVDVCIKCGKGKELLDPEPKSQSQIAIDKVIEALIDLSANMILEGQRTSSNWNAREEQIGISMHRLKEKLKEINK